MRLINENYEPLVTATPGQQLNGTLLFYGILIAVTFFAAGFYVAAAYADAITRGN